MLTILLIIFLNARGNIVFMINFGFWFFCIKFWPATCASFSMMCTILLLYYWLVCRYFISVVSNFKFRVHVRLKKWIAYITSLISIIFRYFVFPVLNKANKAIKFLFIICLCIILFLC